MGLTRTERSAGVSLLLAGLVVMLAACDPSRLLSGRGLTPAEAQVPTAGICLGVTQTRLVTITINVDTPAPRCLQVTAAQHLQVVNHTAEAVTVKLASFGSVIASGAQATFDPSFGTYLAPGVHRVFMSNYPGSGGAELWLVTADPGLPTR